MLIPAFQLSLNNDVLPGLATVGSYDGQHPCLTCGTTGGKVFVHNPHQRGDEFHQEIQVLNINQQVSALQAGCLDEADGRDALLVGTATNLMAYDVTRNTDFFYKDVEDGVKTIAVGTVGKFHAPLAIVGGNGSIQGIDHTGEEKFWTVTGDQVSSLALCDVDEDGENELLVGSDDNTIRVFRNEDVITETSETDKILSLCNMRGTRYGYALNNGTVGVYDRATRIWRHKAKHNATAIQGFDLDGDGIPELIAGWSNGKLEVRSDKSGDVIFKDTFDAPISAIVKADYRLDGKEEVMVCSQDGNVRGYLPVDDSVQGSLLEQNPDEGALAELLERKQELLFELRTYEESLQRQGKTPTSASMSANTLPSTTSIDIRLEMNRNERCVELVLTISEESAIIRGAIVFADQLFEGESFFSHPRNPTASLRIPLRPPRDIALELRILCLAGPRQSSSYVVFELTKTLPKFTMHLPVEDVGSVETPQSFVSLPISERPVRLVSWMTDSFLFGFKLAATDQMEVAFVNLRDEKPMKIFVDANEGRVVVRTDDMEIAAEVVQSLAEYLGITELESSCDFPDELEQFRQLLFDVDNINAVRQKLTAEMADNSQLVKTLVIKAEDARIQGNMRTMKRFYAQLFDLNKELIGEYLKRANNHATLLAALKKVNLMIQRAARLRVGEAKASIIANCRSAMQDNQVQSLFKIIKTGAA